MNPAFKDGDLVAVDASLNDTDKLNGKVIVASHRKHGLLLESFRKSRRNANAGVGKSGIYGPLVLGKGRDWRILGKVLWLLRQMP